MARMHGVIELDAAVPATILWVALATSALAATTAMVQNDIKKVLAYSTVSQLGFMFIAVGVGQYSVALFHVVTHAFFKACLFLSAGSVIHGCHHEQDMRKMGGLAKSMPITSICYGVATLAIAGICPFAGYFSKHAILASIAGTPNRFLIDQIELISFIATSIAVCTAFYMARSFIMTFLGSYRGHAEPHEAPLIMTAPVMVLALLSLVGGFVLEHPFMGYLSGLSAQGTSLEHGAEGLLSYLVGSLPGVFGIVLAVYLFILAPRERSLIRRFCGPLEKLFARTYFFDEVLNALVIRPVRKLSGIAFRSVDQSLIQGSAVALGNITSAVGELTCRITTGQVTTYLFLMFGAAATLFGIFTQVR